MFIPTRELCYAKFTESVLANIFYSSCKLTLLMKALLASVWDSANETCLSSTSTLSVVASLTANFIAILSTVSFCLWRRDFANLRIAVASDVLLCLSLNLLSSSASGLRNSQQLFWNPVFEVGRSGMISELVHCRGQLREASESSRRRHLWLPVDLTRIKTWRKKLCRLSSSSK